MRRTNIQEAPHAPAHAAIRPSRVGPRHAASHNNQVRQRHLRQVKAEHVRLARTGLEYPGLDPLRPAVGREDAPSDVEPANPATLDAGREVAPSDVEPANPATLDVGPANPAPSDVGPSSPAPLDAGPAGNLAEQRATAPESQPALGAKQHALRPARLKKSSWAAVAFLLSLITALCAAAYVGGEFHLLPGSAVSGAPSPSFQGFGQRHEPHPGFEEGNSPLGYPPAPQYFSNSYKFLTVKADGQPVSYSPCRPIHYVINDALAPSAGREIIDDAVRKVSQATGLKFVYDGTTDELPADGRASYQPDKYGDRWAPVLIAWTSPAVVPRLAGQTIGLGGSSSIGLSNGYKAYVTGTLSLDAAQFRQVLTAWNGRDVGAAVVMHELGHLLGLDHVDDPTQLMYDEASSVHDFAAGDLAGLAKLGTGPCSKNF
ncbi:matrixin family metalloprotease [Arthrobacter sp. M4]|uniref:matrixin family metalloprotease n=1 Tax=Arthrobacter sp. M4 TaxID=218160 RepID=UPI001CDC0007|nr:matrixin family metalloprotease [Arthrobacter sp. M4]MCA4133913.1 matrixin family metalloprotease [Arthrobacter sp. M4]